MSRYVVTELVGYLEASVGSTDRPPGLSCQVVDTFGARRLFATYRSEDFNSLGRGRAWERVRRLANEHAARLNAP